MEWEPQDCRGLAEELLGAIQDRWRHVCGVAALTASWVEAGWVPEAVCSAAWLHDIGYAGEVVRTGMHALDGASYLDLHKVDREIVALVAHHTGAYFEADERGLNGRLLAFDFPDQDNLDALTLADLLTSPAGDRVTVDERIAEILSRYEAQHPVHRAVQRSRNHLRESAGRAARRVGYPM